MTVSVVIPTLNEARVVASTVRRTQALGPHEVIVVDGGSDDDTVAQAEGAGACVVHGPRGRGPQLNRGADRASGEALLFLHADTRLPPHALDVVRRTLSAPDAEAGLFRLRFDRETPLLRFYAWCTRWPWIRLAFGDRALFVTRDAFEAVGGYPRWPIFEDLELADRLHARGGVRFVEASVTTSARRFRRHGTLRQQLRNLALWLHYLAGGNPTDAARFYAYDAPRTDASGEDASSEDLSSEDASSEDLSAEDVSAEDLSDKDVSASDARR